MGRPGPNGLDGWKGEAGEIRPVDIGRFRGPDGMKGDIGYPGQPGIPGNPGLGGVRGFPGLDGFRGMQVYRQMIINYCIYNVHIYTL